MRLQRSRPRLRFHERSHPAHPHFHSSSSTPFPPPAKAALPLFFPTANELSRFRSDVPRAVTDDVAVAADFAVAGLASESERPLPFLVGDVSACPSLEPSVEARLFCLPSCPRDRLVARLEDTERESECGRWLCVEEWPLVEGWES